MAAAIKPEGVKALRLLFVFAASVPERVAATALTTESAALPVVKSIGPLALCFPPFKDCACCCVEDVGPSIDRGDVEAFFIVKT